MVAKTKPLMGGHQGQFCFVAEKQGFEPWLEHDPTNGFRNRPLQPLGYFSTLAACSILAFIDSGGNKRV